MRISVTGAENNWTDTIDVTNIVQQIVTDLGNNVAAANNGFMMELQTEVHYREHSWASSDYADSTYWPELVVTYSNYTDTSSKVDEIKNITLSTEIMPNPTHTGWNIRLDVPHKQNVTINVYDLTGREISSSKQKVTAGKQILYQDATKFTPGIYFIEIRGNEIQFKEKAIKY